jgi:succinate dehydrogenase / fumarate reductase cytochrome b subunit
VVIIFRKTMIALTGLFLCLFLTVHLGANLLLLLPEATAHGLYNAYSSALRGNPFIAVIAYVNYACFLFHILYGLGITLRNRGARRVDYAENKKIETSTWSSQNMGLLGTALLAFLIIHLANFWYRVKFLGDESDIYAMVITLFKEPGYVLVYSAAMLPLGLHLSHGVLSALRSLGLYHKKYLQTFSKISTAYAVAVGIGFALIPVVVFLKVRAS